MNYPDKIIPLNRSEKVIKIWRREKIVDKYGNLRIEDYVDGDLSVLEDEGWTIHSFSENYVYMFRYERANLS